MQAGDNKSYDDINVTPMVDLTWFSCHLIIMTTAACRASKVNLPRPEADKKTRERRLRPSRINSEAKFS